MSRWMAVVFDLDGTLADTIGLIIASYRHAVSEVLGIGVDPELARDWIGRTLVDTFTERYPDRASELVDSYVTWNLAHAATLIARYEGVVELVAELLAAGVKVGIATSKRRGSAELTCGLVGLELPVTVALEDTEFHKPDPLPLLLALERLDARREGAVYIGDAVVDVQAAKAAGMASIAVTWGAGRKADLVAAGPDHLVTTVADLRALLLADVASGPS